MQGKDFGRPTRRRHQDGFLLQIVQSPDQCTQDGSLASTGIPAPQTKPVFVPRQKEICRHGYHLPLPVCNFKRAFSLYKPL